MNKGFRSKTHKTAEERRAYLQNWRKLNRERNLNQRRQHYAENKEDLLLIKRTYYERNRERILRYHENRRKSPEQRYISVKSSAKSRNLSFNISFDTYLSLMEQPCYYCGGTLPPMGSGLDRVRSNRGYTAANVVPCCKYCNRAKSDMTQTQFIKWILRTANYWANKPT